MAYRTCIGCKVVCDKNDLIRLVVDTAKLVVDRTKRCKGRGAYVHPRAACIRKGLDAKLIAHRLRLKGQVIDLSELKDLFAEVQMVID